MIDVTDSKNWVILPPGDRVLLRHPAPEVLTGTELASVRDIVAANHGAAFPWGSRSTPDKAGRLWHEHRLGTGGLYHTAWFVCREGRVGGAPNVSDTLPGSQRSCLYLDGGSCAEGQKENEGYALVKKTSADDRDMYRRVMLHAAEHIMTDGGFPIVTTIGKDGVVGVGFGGYCRNCPNPELITIKQLRVAVPEYRFELLPEWRGWRLERAA